MSGPRLVVLIATVAFLLALTLMPRQIVAPVRNAVMHLAYAFAEPAVSGMSFIQVESTLNALVFIPLGVALAIIFGRKLWLFAPVFAFAISFTIEYLQVRVPGRVPDVNDIVWNTMGGLIGACIVALIRMMRTSPQE
ncbi:VanZ family protein [Microbacterium sp. YY-03]|uniref:VanZ family protein n=1 Tax=Microbacterium sp. YY-03 TaxID=3421636 RepID=UPI003D16EDE2